MKRHWIVVENDREIASEYGEDFSRPLTFVTEAEAERKARALAEENLGTKYSVFALVSSFSVSAMVEERAK